MTNDDVYYNELQEYFNNLAQELNCSIPCAMNVWYLRQRSRWNQDCENQLIELDNQGIQPNMNEFP
jgi:hypothetical protein